MEVSELQTASVYRNKHQEGSVPEFCCSLDSAQQVCCVSWSTHISIMNMNKKKERSFLTGENFEDILKTSTKIVVSTYKKLNADKYCNVYD
jgi:hypothetical protein